VGILLGGSRDNPDSAAEERECYCCKNSCVNYIPYIKNVNEAASNAVIRVSLDSTQQLPSPCNFFRISLQTVIWPYDIPSDMYGYLMIQINGCRGANKLYTIGENVTIPCSFSIPMCLTSGTGLFQYYAQSNIEDTVDPRQSAHSRFRVLRVLLQFNWTYFGNFASC